VRKRFLEYSTIIGKAKSTNKTTVDAGVAEGQTNGKKE